jgi:dCMP deaminase
MAWAVSVKSKDPKCQVGAVIVTPDRIVLSTGFNGLARGVFDDPRLLAKASEKIKIICHAEQNAILNAARVGAALGGSSIFVTKFPCLACCNAIVQAGITRIYTHDDSFWKDDPLDRDHSRKMKVLKQSGVDVDAPYHPKWMSAEQINPRRKKPVKEDEPGSVTAADTGARHEVIDPRKKKAQGRVTLANLARLRKAR